jgi:hypothetical protein
MPAILDSVALDRVRADLEAIEGIRRAVVDPGPPCEVFVVADRSSGSAAELVVHSVLARHGLSAADAQVHLSYLSAPEPRRRVRFISCGITHRHSGALATVQLEWAGSRFTGELEGESGPAVELRLIAMATVAALDRVLGGRVKIQMVGIKPFRAFDADVVVALLRSDVDGKSLIGAAMAEEDPRRAAAIAVLNATNRILGNYLMNEESASQ